MCPNGYTRLVDLDQTKMEIEAALSAGKVHEAVEKVQCLWALCSCMSDHSQCLDHIEEVAKRCVLPAKSRERLTARIKQERRKVRKERLLAAA